VLLTLRLRRPVKQKRALLESNPLRDNRTQRRRNKTVSTFGEAKTSPRANQEGSVSEPEHASENSPTHAPKTHKTADLTTHVAQFTRPFTHKFCYRAAKFH